LLINNAKVKLLFRIEKKKAPCGTLYIQSSI
jgi:hypothetical protein